MSKATELAEGYLALAKDRGCGDGNCVVMRPRGMHTNGGCRCAKDMNAADVVFVRRLLAIAQELATEVIAAKTRQDQEAFEKDMIDRSIANMRLIGTPRGKWRRLGRDFDGTPLGIIEPHCGECRIASDDGPSWCGCGKKPGGAP